MLKWYQEPLLHFLLIGTLLFFVADNTQSFSFKDSENTIIINKNKLDEMATFWEKKYNTTPTKEELDSMVKYYVENEMLYREALKMKLDKNDKQMKQLLVNKVKYIMKESDTLHISDETLKAYYKEHQEDFIKNLTRYLTFGHIYVNPNKHQDSQKLADDIYKKVKDKPFDDSFSKKGDNFYAGAYFSNISTKALKEYFSHTFINTLKKLPSSQWSKPIKSGFGIHLIYIEKNTQTKDVFSALKKEIRNAYIIEQNQLHYEKFYQNIKKSYTIEVAPYPVQSKK